MKVLCLVCCLAAFAAFPKPGAQAESGDGSATEAQEWGLAFASAVIYDSGGTYAFSVAVADVNGDGIPDLVVANHCAYENCASGLVGVLLGNGDGTFQPAMTYDSGGDWATTVAVADINGDGYPDIVVANYWANGYGNVNGTVGVLLGNGDGTFQRAVTYESGGTTATAVVVADVNGDGKPDLVVTSEAGLRKKPKGSVVGILFGNGDGTFQPAVTYGSGGSGAQSVLAADVNGDGKLDLVVANFSAWGPKHGSIGVLLGNGDGTFRPAVSYDSGGAFAISVAIADFNGDGNPDIAVTNCDPTGQNGPEEGLVGVLLGNGDGTFQKVVTYASGGTSAYWLAAGDVNGDGKPDLVVVTGGYYGYGGAGVLLGNGDGTFKPAVTFDQGVAVASSVAIADVNGDGKPDLLVTNECGDGGCDNGVVDVLLNESTSTPIASPPPNPR